jgi:small subunit ribosomal protein S17
VIKWIKRLMVHDDKNECHEGDTVKVMETRPFSRNKRWRLVEVIEKRK